MATLGENCIKGLAIKSSYNELSNFNEYFKSKDYDAF